MGKTKEQRTAAKTPQGHVGGTVMAPTTETATGGEPRSVRDRLSGIVRKPRTTIEQVRAEYDVLRKTFCRGDILKERWVPELYRELHMRVLTGRCSKGERIKLHCAECMGWQNVREEVRNCTARTCHLYGVRPYQVKREAKHLQDHD